MRARREHKARESRPPPKSRELASWSVPILLRLTRKLASSLDGIDLSRYAVGDFIELPRYEAELLIAEKWAEAVTESSMLGPPNDQGDSRETFPRGVEIVAEAADVSTATLEQLCERCRQVELNPLRPQERRRNEDRIREELQDSRARIVPKTLS
jgi:hypothetical protein